MRAELPNTTTDWFGGFQCSTSYAKARLGGKKMQTDDKTKGGKSDRGAFCSQNKTKIVQCLLNTC